MNFTDSDSALLLLIFLVVALVPGILYIITLQNTLKAISPENRKTEPGTAWLLLIPLFNLVWHFILVGNIADSIRNESFKKGFTVDEDRPGYNTGLTMCILQCCGIIPLLGTLASLGALICWIIYWTKIAAYKRQIINASVIGGNEPTDLIRF